MALIHAPDSASGYPFPFGYITASRNIVDRIAYRIAELASRADGTKAVLWTRAGEDAHKALAMMDEALGDWRCITAWAQLHDHAPDAAAIAATMAGRGGRFLAFPP